MRTAAAGRNWEGFGADPYLAGEAAYETIKGIQGAGVQTSAKHFINNEQEHYRQNSSSIVDDRTQHEIYLAPVSVRFVGLVRGEKMLTEVTVPEERFGGYGVLHVQLQYVL